jgi:membrane-bound metal-dependent hydrolase YbcI (DUF457 family)
MPFTPFHFGPGAALKAAMRSRFSFTVFCYSQVVTDFESAFYLFRGEYPVHRFFHTYLGATLVGLACALTGRHMCQFALRVFERTASISWGVAFTSAFIGTYSHVFLDSIMHRDVIPLAPFSTANSMLLLMSLPVLHLLCLGLGVIGVLVYVMLGKR